jgi:hypothetical protein
MCKKWELEFVAMVGVGNQESTGDGATACVCQVPGKQAPVPAPTGSSAPPPAPAGSASSSALSPSLLASEAAMAAKLVDYQRKQINAAPPL